MIKQACLLLLLSITFYCQVNAQNSAKVKRGENELGFLLSKTSFMLLNGSNQNLINSFESNSSFEMGFSVGFPAKNKRLSYHMEIRISQKYGSVTLINDDHSKVSEYLIQLPFLIKQYLVDDEKYVKPYIAIGVYSELPLYQKLYLSDGIQVPTDFIDEYKMSYLKFGVLGEWGTNFVVDENSSFSLGLRVALDFKDMYINSNNNPAYDYSVYSINFKYLYGF